ncbi:MAG: HK97 gp10 family phage protein [Patescibacteria group bacterium]|nr:HK97 gp10 family phage protein [Patescibacteria group bacterium]
MIPIPACTFTIEGIDQLQKRVLGVLPAGGIESGVRVEGPATAYALVWEWGNLRQTKKGPRTVWGVNPDGSGAWLSTQAPRGYIRVLEAEYNTILQGQFKGLTLRASDPQKMREDLTDAMNTAADKIANVVKGLAPVDTGELSAGIVSVHVGDSLLKEIGGTELVVG